MKAKSAALKKKAFDQFYRTGKGHGKLIATHEKEYEAYGKKRHAKESKNKPKKMDADRDRND